MCATICKPVLKVVQLQYLMKEGSPQVAQTCYVTGDCADWPKGNMWMCCVIFVHIQMLGSKPCSATAHC